jgi:hypothetical protein
LAPREERTVARKSRKTIRIELTDSQKKQIREQLGEEVETVEYTVEELEQRITPRSIGTFF